jgi:hypothetical protein
VEKEWSASIRSSRRTFWGSWEGEGMTGGGVPTADRSGGGEELDGEGIPVRVRGQGWAGELEGATGKLSKGS